MDGGGPVKEAGTSARGGGAKRRTDGAESFPRKD